MQVVGKQLAKIKVNTLINLFLIENLAIKIIYRYRLKTKIELNVSLKCEKFSNIISFFIKLKIQQ